MITLEQFSLSLALALVLAFIAGCGFGVWLALRTMSRIYTQISKPEMPEIRNFKPSPVLVPKSENPESTGG